MSEHDLLLALAELEEAKRLLEWRRQVVLDMLDAGRDDGDPATTPPLDATQKLPTRQP